MADPQIRALARRLASLERSRLASKQPSLSYSTIQGGALQAADDDDNLTMVIGKQFDGTNTASVVTGPTPPVPTAPYVVSATGALRIYWDGTFEADAITPMDFARVIAYAVPLDDFTDYEPLNQAIMVGQFTSATGGELTAALDGGVEYLIYLVTWTQPGRYSPASQTAVASPAVAADSAAVDAALQQAGQAIDDAAAASSAASAADQKATDAASAAAQAATDADAAKQQAAAVALEVDTKNRTFFEPAEPTTGMVAGDVWYNESDGFKPHRYDGTDWVPIQDADILAAAQAAAAADAKAVAAQEDATAAATQASQAATAASSAAQAAADADAKAAAAQSAADDADAKAVQAIQDADAAADLAGTKNRTWFQAGDPGTAATPGDVWYDTDNGFFPRRRNAAGGWDDIQDQDILAAAQAASNAAQAAADADAKAAAAQSDANAADAKAAAAQSDATAAATAASNAAQAASDADARAVAAQQAADAADDAAAAAATLAGSKNKTWFQAGDPGTNAAPGDVWYDTDDKYRPRRRNAAGTGWDDIRDQAILDAADAAAAADTKATNAASEASQAASDAAAASAAAQAASEAAEAAQEAAGLKNSTFRQATKPWEDGDASHADDIGDLWFHTGEQNAPYMWDGDSWVNTRDGKIDAVETLVNGQAVDVATHGEQIEQTQEEIDAIRATATDAYGTAYAADGRVSISDYEPGPNDVEGKNDGSLWITRTRDRLNQCDNPSFELGVTGWTVTGGSGARVASATALNESDYVFQITNAGAGRATWGENTPLNVAVGEQFAASAFLQYVSGATMSATATIEFLDVNGATLSTVTGDVVDFIDDDGDSLIDTDWRRVFVLATVPEGADDLVVHFDVPQTTTTWNLDAVLVEADDQLGRYFDGDSPGGEWEGTPHASRGVLDGGAIIRLFTLEDGGWNEKFWTADTISSVNASTIDRGQMNGGFLADGTVPVDKQYADSVTCYEAIEAGDLVNIFSNSGVAMIRRARADQVGQEAHGFVLVAGAPGEALPVYTNGYNPMLTDLQPGTIYLSTSPGKTAARGPYQAGRIIQRVGYAPTASTLNFMAGDPVVIT